MLAQGDRGQGAQPGSARALRLGLSNGLAGDAVPGLGWSLVDTGATPVLPLVGQARAILHPCLAERGRSPEQTCARVFPSESSSSSRFRRLQHLNG